MRIIGLWSKESQDGGKRLAGKTAGGCWVNIVKNKFKKTENQHDYFIEVTDGDNFINHVREQIAKDAEYQERKQQGQVAPAQPTRKPMDTVEDVPF
jgi:allantoicase